ncbi:predicted protein [Naegleria gruberi]|uniref:Predicted protein n=1 Tax=Naegleria gruberi TaxID=5762 RepID=D2W2T9_NAEGR|nr:uncharacterized protein NAEGRDRAFT_75710 [Naegleria gruberi]EFC36610.1 predicted protein [Naegleria gruberi]|eukprot:XP_002669354.1 predicted protein [Naegleria gruberi strain NEG-M]
MSITTELNLFIYKLPTSEEFPTTIHVRTVTSDAEFEKVFESGDSDMNEHVILNIPFPNISREHKIEIKLCMPEVRLEKKFPFNLTSDGTFILFDGSQGLRFKQRFDGNFGQAYITSKHSSHATSISENSKNFKKSPQKTGFEYDVKTGETNYQKIIVNEKSNNTSSSTSTSQIGKSKNDSIIQDLEKLASLRDSGILTEEEFTAKKRVILGI